MHRLHAHLDKVYTAMLVGRKLENASSQHDDLVHHLLSSQEALSEDEIKSMLLVLNDSPKFPHSFVCMREGTSPSFSHTQEVSDTSPCGKRSP
eukprot:c6996_g1_i1 orf=184-462(+)